MLFGRITYEQMASFWPTPAAMEMMPEVAKGMNEHDEDRVLAVDEEGGVEQHEADEGRPRGRSAEAQEGRPGHGDHGQRQRSFRS